MSSPPPFSDTVIAAPHWPAAAASFPARPGAVRGAGELWLTRFLVLRLLGLVYLMAFLTWVNQGPALVGRHGLLPAHGALAAIAQAVGGRLHGFAEAPSLFWISDSDALMFGAGWVGVALSLTVLAGYANALMLLALFALQVSLLPVGQIFYGFGWELQLCETGFLCIFLVPLLDGRPFPRRPPSPIVMWLLRWLIVRIMLGAGLIKLRGDPCWRDLTCLDYHFATQPIPNPLSPLFHALPPVAHKLGVLFNHVAELAAPFCVFGPRRVRHAGAAVMAALQVILICSGNLAFLNWLTLIPIIACCDDGVWRRVLPARLLARADHAAARAVPSKPARYAAIGLAVVVGILSVPVVLNLASGRQAMNTSFTRLPLVNSYGAFGTVGRQREELIFEGTAEQVLTPATVWKPYQWKCKPGDPDRAPCWMSPYHRRLDWLAWFAAMSTPDRYPFMAHLVWKLLENDRATLSLLAANPFPDAPPRHIRVDLYRYEMSSPGAKSWWTRTRLDSWLPPLSREDAPFAAYIRHRWPE